MKKEEDEKFYNLQFKIFYKMLESCYGGWAESFYTETDTWNILPNSLVTDLLEQSREAASEIWEYAVKEGEGTEVDLVDSIDKWGEK